MILPDGHGTQVAVPILAVPNEEMEIGLKGGGKSPDQAGLYLTRTPKYLSI